MISDYIFFLKWNLNYNNDQNCQKYCFLECLLNLESKNEIRMGATSEVNKKFEYKVLAEQLLSYSFSDASVDNKE